MTLTSAGVMFSIGAPVAQAALPIELTEGKSYTYFFEIEMLKRATVERPALGAPTYGYVEANGKRFKASLGFNEVYAITGKRPIGLRWAMRALVGVIPWPGKKRRLRAWQDLLTGGKNTAT